MNIEIRNLQKKFNDNEVLKDISLKIEKNKSTIILGQSGCGKSVLIKIIYQLLNYEKGTILYEGKKNIDIDKFSMLFQYGALFDSLTLSENIAFTDYMDNKINYSRKVKSLMADVGLDASNYHKYPSEVSGGMKKRAGLARAMALDPDVLFLDEPSAGLDPINSHRLDNLINELKDSLGMTFVVVTHELSSIFDIADNSIFLDGETKTLIDHGSPSHLKTNSENEKVRSFLRRGAPIN